MIRFEHEETEPIDDSYGETVLVIRKDGQEIGRVVVFVSVGSAERQGRPYVSVDVKPHDWQNWQANLLSFTGKVYPDGKAYMQARVPHDETLTGHLFYTIAADPSRRPASAHTTTY